jgi:hypothetical protein
VEIRRRYQDNIAAFRRFANAHADRMDWRGQGGNSRPILHKVILFLKNASALAF